MNRVSRARHGSESGEARKKAIQADERRLGPRKDRPARAIHRTLPRGTDLPPGQRCIHIDADEKTVYPGHLERAFGADRIECHRTNSLVPRETWSPLFPVNSEEARARDTLGRLRREPWLVSKALRWIDIALHVHIAHRSYVRRRSLDQEHSPASMLGFVERRRPT